MGVGALSVNAAQAKVSTNETVSHARSGWVPCANGGAGELSTSRIDVHNLVPSTDDDNVYSWQFQFQPRSGNNLVVRETAHVTIDGEDLVVQHDDFAIECG